MPFPIDLDNCRHYLFIPSESGTIPASVKRLYGSIRRPCSPSSPSHRDEIRESTPAPWAQDDHSTLRVSPTVSPALTLRKQHPLHHHHHHHHQQQKQQQLTGPHSRLVCQRQSHEVWIQLGIVMPPSSFSRAKMNALFSSSYSRGAPLCASAVNIAL